MGNGTIMCFWSHELQILECWFWSSEWCLVYGVYRYFLPSVTFIQLVESKWMWQKLWYNTWLHAEKQGTGQELESKNRDLLLQGFPNLQSFPTLGNLTTCSSGILISITYLGLLLSLNFSQDQVPFLWWRMKIFKGPTCESRTVLSVQS